MASGGDALHDGRLTRRDHHVAGVWRKSSLRTGERKAGGEEEVLLKHWFLVGGWRGALTRFSTLFFNVESNGSYG